MLNFNCIGYIYKRDFRDTYNLQYHEVKVIGLLSDDLSFKPIKNVKKYNISESIRYYRIDTDQKESNDYFKNCSPNNLVLLNLKKISRLSKLRGLEFKSLNLLQNDAQEKAVTLILEHFFEQNNLANKKYISLILAIMSNYTKIYTEYTKNSEKGSDIRHLEFLSRILESRQSSDPILLNHIITFESLIIYLVKKRKIQQIKLLLNKYTDDNNKHCNNLINIIFEEISEKELLRTEFKPIFELLMEQYSDIFSSNYHFNYFNDTIFNGHLLNFFYQKMELDDIYSSDVLIITNKIKFDKIENLVELKSYFNKYHKFPEMVKRILLIRYLVLINEKGFSDELLEQKKLFMFSNNLSSQILSQLIINKTKLSDELHKNKISNEKNNYNATYRILNDIQQFYLREITTLAEKDPALGVISEIKMGDIFNICNKCNKEDDKRYSSCRVKEEDIKYYCCGYQQNRTKTNFNKNDEISQFCNNDNTKLLPLKGSNMSKGICWNCKTEIKFNDRNDRNKKCHECNEYSHLICPQCNNLYKSTFIEKKWFGRSKKKPRSNECPNNPDMTKGIAEYKLPEICQLLNIEMLNNQFLGTLVDWVNRLNEIREKLKCKQCNHVLYPIFEKKNKSVVYLFTKYYCPNKNCIKHEEKIYINHCFNCGNYIDSRDTMKSGSHFYICPECLSYSREKHKGKMITYSNSLNLCCPNDGKHLKEIDIKTIEKKEIVCPICNNDNKIQLENQNYRNQIYCSKCGNSFRLICSLCNKLYTLPEWIYSSSYKLIKNEVKKNEIIAINHEEMKPICPRCGQTMRSSKKNKGFYCYCNNKYNGPFTIDYCPDGCVNDCFLEVRGDKPICPKCGRIMRPHKFGKKSPKGFFCSGDNNCGSHYKIKEYPNGCINEFD